MLFKVWNLLCKPMFWQKKNLPVGNRILNKFLHCSQNMWFHMKNPYRFHKFFKWIKFKIRIESWHRFLKMFHKFYRIQRTPRYRHSTVHVTIQPEKKIEKKLVKKIYYNYCGPQSLSSCVVYEKFVATPPFSEEKLPRAWQSWKCQLWKITWTHIPDLLDHPRVLMEESTVDFCEQASPINKDFLE